MSALDTLMETHPLPTWRPAARAIMGLLATLLVWANFATLDEVATAEGEVVPQGKVKVIQHLEGGIVEQIFVEDGALVKPGDPLVQLNLGTSAGNREELQVRLDGFTLSRARLLAEANGIPVDFPAEESQRRPDLLQAEHAAYDAQTRGHESTLGVLRSQVRQRELDIQELNAKRQGISRSLELGRKKLAMSSDLLSQGLTPKMDHVQLEREIEALHSDLGSIEPTIPRAQSALEETHQRLDDETIRFRRDALEKLNDIEQNIARTRQLLTEASNQAARTEIKSPIDGVVKNLKFHTIGGVVRPGDPIMEIVPSREALVIEARLSPTDRGYVQAGQPALVKISTYDFVRYGGLKGTVVLVAPDSTVDPQGKPYFRLLVLTDRDYLGGVAGNLPISSGMQATVDVHTGERTVMQYLVKPVLKLRHEAFRER